MWANVRVYEKATGAQANGKKFEGLRLGKTRDSAYDGMFAPKLSAETYTLKATRDSQDVTVKVGITVPKGWGIKWCKKGEYLMSLGIPHGWDFSLKDFLTSKYVKCKQLEAQWRDVAKMSPHGSARVANSMVYSRFRYYASCLKFPSDLTKALASDTQMLIWSKDPDFDLEQLGSETARGLIQLGQQYTRWKEGGIGLIDWESHLKGLAAVWLYRYCAAGEPPYVKASVAAPYVRPCAAFGS